MKRLLTLVSVLCLVFSGGLGLVPKVSAAANNNNLIDDYTFDNTSSLTAGQIDSWLNTFPNSCISPNSGFAAADPTGYTPNYPYVDGKYLYGGTVSAGQVIYDAAVGEHVNPQVLLTKLQNEEQLVDGSAGCSSTWRYASAVGYACTDSDTYSHNYSYTGADPFSDGSALPTPIYYRNGSPVNSITGSCVNHNVFAGFSEQIAHAAWALSIWRHKSEGQTGWAAVNGNWNHCDDINTCPANMNIPASWGCYSGLMTQGTFKRCPTDSSGVYYDGYATIDGQTLHMDNGATAALYVYTPHIQSFDNIFNGYFGSQYSNDTFSPHPNGSLIVENNAIYLIDNGTKRWIANPDVFTSYHFLWSDVVRESTGDRSLPFGTSITTFAPGTLFTSPGQPVYVMDYDQDSTLKKHAVSLDAFLHLGYQWNQIMNVRAGEVPAASFSSLLTAYQHPVGTLVVLHNSVYQIMTDATHASSGTLRHVVTPTAFESYNFDWGAIMPATTLDQNYPIGQELESRTGSWMLSNNNIYLISSDTSGDYKQPVGPWECFANRLGYGMGNLLPVPAGELPTRTSGLYTC